jgi:hypothetical protein
MQLNDSDEPYITVRGILLIWHMNYMAEGTLREGVEK